MSVTVQIQSIIYHNEKEPLMRAFESLANAVRVNRETAKNVGDVTVSYGDASKAPVFSADELCEIQERFAPYFAFRYTFFNENTGTSKGHNRLCADCDSEYLVVMNPDVIVCPRFFEKMLAPFSDPTKNAGAVEARQTPVEHPKEYDKTTLETEWITGACFMVPTELYRAIGGFDAEMFFLYCDDVDFSWRMRLYGKTLYYRPDCPAFHAKRLSATANWQPTEAEVYYSKEAALLMAYKWSDMQRVKVLCDRYASEGALGAKVLAHFQALKEAGKLPAQLDPEHKIAKFVNEDYSERRFLM